MTGVQTSVFKSELLSLLSVSAELQTLMSPGRGRMAASALVAHLVTALESHFLKVNTYLVLHL